MIDPQAKRELAPGGELVVGVVQAPQAGVFFVGLDPATGQPSGVTAALGSALAAELSVPVRFRVHPNSGECTEALAAGAVSVAFMPVDDERRRTVEFGPAYYQLESTYLVTRQSGVSAVDGVDAAGMRVIGIANTTTIRASARTLSRTQPVAVRSVEDALDAMRSGQADALALSRDSLASLAPSVPGSVIVAGHFQRTGVAIAVPKGRVAAHACVSAFLERAKADGLVRRIFDAAGLGGEAVAPLGA